MLIKPEIPRDNKWDEKLLSFDILLPNLRPLFMACILGCHGV